MNAFSRRRSFITITFVFICSRFLFWLAGIQFYGSFAHRMWQLLDIEWLRTQFIESIFYYHAQPPAFNTLTAVAIKVFPGHYYLVFRLIMLAFSWASAWMLYDTLQEMKVKRSISLLIALFFLLNPALVLYENLYSYTTMTVFLVTAVVYALVRFTGDRTIGRWSLFVGSATVLCLTRSTFHLVWFLFLLPVVWTLVPQRFSFKLIWVAAFVLVMGLYVKNYVLFGSFSTSSWFGMNMARLVSPSSRLGTIGPFRPVSNYPDEIGGANPYPAVVSLASEKKSRGFINFNHYRYVGISQQFGADSFDEIRRHPSGYIGAVGRAFVSYFNPSAHAPFVGRNYAVMGSYARWMTLDFSSWERYDKSRISATSALPAFLFYAIVLAMSIRYRRSWFVSPLTRVTVPFLWFILAYGMLVGNLFEYGENNRFRFEVHTPFLILTALVIDRFLDKIRNSYR